MPPAGERLADNAGRIESHADADLSIDSDTGDAFILSGQCLCGAHRFELEGKLELNHHCHCGYCRKHHGTGYASLVGVAAERFRWERGEMIRYQSSPTVVRESCATCGTPLPQQIEGLPVFVPAGCLDDFDVAFDFHIFAASKAECDEIADGLPAFDAYPPGVEANVQETRPPLDPPGGVRGSCLCGDVRYVIDGTSITARHCPPSGLSGRLVTMAIYQTCRITLFSLLCSARPMLIGNDPRRDPSSRARRPTFSQRVLS